MIMFSRVFFTKQFYCAFANSNSCCNQLLLEESFSIQNNGPNLSNDISLNIISNMTANFYLIKFSEMLMVMQEMTMKVKIIVRLLNST